MGRKFLMIVLLALLCAPSVAKEKAPIQPVDTLRILEIENTGLSREDLYRSFKVLEDLGPFLVARPSHSDRANLKKMDIPSRKVSIPTDAEGLFIVSLRDLPPDVLSNAATVLYESNDLALVAPREEGYAKLQRPVLHYGLLDGIRPLNLERIRPTRPCKLPPEWKAGSRSVDGQIEDMVSQVSETNLQDIVQDLEDMGQRRADSGAFTAETYLVDSFNAIGGLNVSTHHFSSSYSDNVIAELPGVVDPSIIYVVGGHYDSASYSGSAPGADDNASGTAGVREIARILSQYQFKYTIRFVCFAAEEVGLVGSGNYCDLLESQGANIGAMINLDMTAYRASGDAYDVDFVTNYSSGSLIDFCSDMFAAYVPSCGVTEGNLSGGTSDHQSFTLSGYPACFPFEDLDQYSPYIHSANDLIGPSANDFALARMITQGALASLATLASPLDMEIDHTPVTSTTNGSGPYPVTAEVNSLIGTDVTQVKLYYDNGSGYVSRDMVPTGSGNQYVSSIPGQTSGTIAYYIEAQDEQGSLERAPDGFDAAYEFTLGHFVSIFEDDFESGDNGWTHGGTYDDWARATPDSGGGYDPPSAFSGTMAWGNNVGPGDGKYSSNADNWLRSPWINCTGKTGLILRYRRWLTVERGSDDKATIWVSGHELYSNPESANLIDTGWALHEVDISAYADNNPAMLLRFNMDADGSVEYGGWTIDDVKVGDYSNGDIAALYASEIYVKASTGGAITFTINGPLSQAGRSFRLALLSAGSAPPSHPAELATAFRKAGSTHNSQFIHTGILDSDGNARVTINFPQISNQSLVGKKLTFAWFTMDPVDFWSNSVGILVVP